MAVDVTVATEIVGGFVVERKIEYDDESEQVSPKFAGFQVRVGVEETNKLLFVGSDKTGTVGTETMQTVKDCTAVVAVINPFETLTLQKYVPVVSDEVEKDVVVPARLETKTVLAVELSKRMLIVRVV